ncbi:MAG: acyltransferase family protein [Microlunatus sp.]
MAATTPTVTTPGIRLHGLDALRAGALLLGIVLHSLLPFVPGVPWLVVDNGSRMVAGIPVYVIHLFRMALFMLLAGYFGRMVLHRRGTTAYLKDRLVRILLPFVAFWPLAVLPLGVLAVVNAQLQGTELPQPPTTDDTGGNAAASFNPGQLWFLLVLMQCALIVVLLRSAAIRVLGADRCAAITAVIGRILSVPGGMLLAALPYAIGLLLQGSVIGGVIAPATILPEAPALTVYLGAFVVGWTLHSLPDAFPRIARWWPVYLGAAVILSVVGLGQSDPATPTPLPFAATTMALAAWSWVYALLGLCVRFLHAEHRWIRYLADASYWMYLIHLPLLVGFEILLVAQPWPILVKLGLTWLVVGAVMVISYHLLVRSTPIGRWLNGHRYPFQLPFRGESRA